MGCTSGEADEPMDTCVVLIARRNNLERCRVEKIVIYSMGIQLQVSFY